MVDTGIFHNSSTAGIPASPWDQIYENVWVGGSEVAYPQDSFDAVISVFDWTTDTREDWLPARGVPHISIPFSDGAHVPKAKVEMLADQVEFWSIRGSVLVRCQAGLNRSSLIVARWLMKYKGFSAREAISLIRQKRSIDCLCNKQFVNYLIHKKDEVE